jgi:voltage-gated potassium channel
MADAQSNPVAELDSIKKRFRTTAALALLMLCGGAVFYHLVEHFGWLNSFYFTTVTLASVGFGDFVPKTDAGKLFTIFYILIGIGIIGYFINLLTKNAALRREIRHSKRHPTL